VGGVALAALAAGAALARGRPSGGPDGEERKTTTNADEISGTWALQQVGSLPELERALPTVIVPALETPGLRGFSLRVPWQAIDESFGLLDAGLQAARERGLAFAIRFMAGRHTPAWVFAAGSPFYRREGTGEQVPSPYEGDGAPNTAFESAYAELVSRLAAWCRTHGVRLLHLAWYGQDWAELNHGREVRALPGYAYQRWLEAHTRLIDIGLAHAGPELTVELPFSGYGPLTDAALAFAAHVVGRIGPADPRFFCQANGWGPGGEWGAPNEETEAAFDRVWVQPVCRGLQAIQPQDYDWPAMYRRVYDTAATYCEVYAPSFTQARRSQLAHEVQQFAAYCRAGAPLPAAR
jgi:hypothetical protein